ncbi:MAG: hypothetical protein JOY80_08170 [Candidatus Dormibacteraeota bacterium]|nr:hypothetical protein [Candidatus Dormibacteraeota bacterium]
MTVGLLFTLVSVGALLASLVVMALLRRQLRRILVDLCSGRDRADFWVSISSVWIVLVGLLAGTATLGYWPEAGGADLFGGATTQIRLLLVGLLGAVLVIAAILLSAIQRTNALAPPPPPPLA